MTNDRSIELDVEVPGTPEEVWRAIATGPGVSSWYVPHTITEEAGGVASASFGPGEGMTVTGRVAEWEPLKRIVFDGGDGDDAGLAFEWLVEAGDGGSCVVRLVNTGFGSGADWDGQYDGMSEGWPMFLTNLRLHLTHFAGQSATASLSGAEWPGDRADAWRRLTTELGIPTEPAVGDRVEVSATDAPALAGTVAEVLPWRLAVVLDQPTPGTAILAAEGYGEKINMSVWTYLYGPGSTAMAANDYEVWGAWLSARA